MFRMMSETIFSLLNSMPRNYAHITGNPDFSSIEGMIFFFPHNTGTIVVADIAELPTEGIECADKIYGFHIHEGTECTDPGMHFDKFSCEHPQHTGDLPVLFENDGRIWSAFYTKRFRPAEVRCKTVVLHSLPDDFRTSPSGNSGDRIACGVIN